MLVKFINDLFEVGFLIEITESNAIEGFFNASAYSNNFFCFPLKLQFDI